VSGVEEHSGEVGYAKMPRMGSRYYVLLIAYLTSSLGNWVYRLALPLLVLHLTGSALSTGVLYAIEYVPFLLLSMPGGVFADRFDRRRLLIAGDTTAGVIAGCLGILVVLDVHTLWPIYVAAFLLACVEPVYHPAFQSFLPDIVPSERLGQANAWMQTGDNIMAMAGPAIAGGLVALFGFDVTVFVNAASFLVSGAAIVLIRGQGKAVRDGAKPRPPLEKAPPRPSFLGEIKEAVRYIFKDNKVLMAGSLMFTGTNFAIWLIQANFIYYLTDYRGFEPDVIGTVLAAQGVGAVVGAAVAGRLIRRCAPGRILIGTTALAGLVTLLLVPVRDPLGIAVVWGLVYALGSINPVAWFTLRQRIVPNHLLGRVVATTRMLAFASIPVSALVAGVVESTFHDIYVLIAIGALLRLLIAGLAHLSPLRTSSSADRDAPVPS
jgi:MFS family permease